MEECQVPFFQSMGDIIMRDDDSIQTLEEAFIGNMLFIHHYAGYQRGSQTKRHGIYP